MNEEHQEEQIIKEIDRDEFVVALNLFGTNSRYKKEQSKESSEESSLFEDLYEESKTQQEHAS